MRPPDPRLLSKAELCRLRRVADAMVLKCISIDSRVVRSPMLQLLDMIDALLEENERLKDATP